jgi:Fe-S-cluster-containing dehydrogenase component/formate-dependent nitrite reductase membrane component NrfD
MIEARAEGGVKWAKVIDHTRCIGCHACTTACKSENEVPLSVTRTYVKYVDVGAFPQTRRAFQVTRCNQCEHAPCVTACPTSAMHRRADGIVDFDKSICIGCKACIAACPYDAIFINPEDRSAEKCNFCAHRLDVGLEPACVVVCPTEAILVGDLNDPLSKVTQIVNRDAVTVRRPEKETLPKLYYKGAHQATLDPLAARRPDGGLFMWSEQGDVPHQVPSGHPGGGNSSAAAVLSYDVPHRAPWDWRVSAYTWTKGIAAGAYLVPLALAVAGVVPWDSLLWLVVAPAVALLFLLATTGLLIGDLTHPERFLLILTRPQWRSWLVRGGFLLLAFGSALAVHFIAGLTGAVEVARWTAVAAAPLAVLTAVYTAYLFAQAKARDLWQNPLSPAQLVLQAVLLGAAAIALVWEVFGDSSAAVPRLLFPPRLEASGTMVTIAPVPEILAWTIAAAAALHLLLLLGEMTITHTTAHARLAAREMTRGRFAVAFWFGVVLVANSLVAPWAGVWAAIPALIGVLAHEHAYVQAGQSVPLA